ncbi:MAG: thioredoxin domain-containing protein [Cytophagales bacterium]|nr:thioredoxin domain-containing protein [Armatimonadota bacterium]
MTMLSLLVDPARDHIQGAADAPVTLVEYGDYECPYCGAAYPIVRSLQHDFGDSLRFVFRNFPLAEVHPHAEHAAEAAEAAGAQHKFWEMHDALYEHQKALGDTKIKELADSLRLDGTTLLEQVKRQVFAPRIEEDFESGVVSGVSSTPTFFINGRRFNGAWNDPAAFREALEQASRE